MNGQMILGQAVSECEQSRRLLGDVIKSYCSLQAAALQSSSAEQGKGPLDSPSSLVLEESNKQEQGRMISFGRRHFRVIDLWATSLDGTGRLVFNS